MKLQRLKDIEENELWTIDEADVRELLGVDARCPHQYTSIQDCQSCLFLIAAMALSELKDKQ